MGEKRDDLAGSKRALYTSLTILIGALGGSGGTLYFQPLVSQKILEGVEEEARATRRTIIELESNARSTKEQLKSIEKRIDSLPPRWVERDINRMDRKIDDHIRDH